MYARTLNRSALEVAWQEVLSGDREDGLAQRSVVAFAQESVGRLDELAERLARGTYEPADLAAVTISKPGGGERILHVPTVTDRVVERAILNGVTPWVDPHLGHAAYGFRPGLGVVDAVQAVAALRDEGHLWVARADVRDCFPSVDAERAVRLLSALVPDKRLLDLVGVLVGRCAQGPGGRHVIPGLPQGSPLSPVLSNLALKPLDDALIHAGFPTVRYADDFVASCRTEACAREALRVATAALEGVGMELGDEKTEVMSYEEGFCFLGEDFGSRYPPRLADHRVDEPDARVLYVAVQGSRVRVTNGRVVVESGERAELLSVPQTQVSRVVSFGSVGLSAGAREWALGTETPAVFLSRRGHYQGQLIGPASRKRVARLRAQLGLSQERGLRLARSCLEGKLVKQATLLKHFVREDNADRVSPLIGQVEALVPMLGESGSVEELMGVEGAAARSYFEALEALIPDELGFHGRNRQPPLDVTNAALSYGYAILQSECVSAIVAAGLDPAIGCLHTDSRNQPALALDMMEEFRPTIVDQVVVQLARSKALRAEHGTTTPGKTGVLLSKAGKTVLVDAYERRMLTKVKALPDFAGSWRRHLYRQAQRLAASIMGDDFAYTGLSWR